MESKHNSNNHSEVVDNSPKKIEREEFLAKAAELKSHFSSEAIKAQAQLSLCQNMIGNINSQVEGANEALGSGLSVNYFYDPKNFILTFKPQPKPRMGFSPVKSSQFEAS